MEHKSIIGIILSGLLGVLKIWTSHKKSNVTELSLIHRNTIPLINTSNTSDTSLKIEHILPFNSNQYYYRGTFINTGNTDLYKGLVIKPLKVKFSDDIKIITQVISEKDNEVEVVSKVIDENEITYEWDLLKPLEKFSFEVIIESAENVSIYELYDKINVTSRIAGIEKIKKNSAHKLEYAKKNFFYNSLPTYFFLLAGYLLAGLILYIGISSFTDPWNTIDQSIISKESKNKVEGFAYHDKSNVRIRFEDDSKQIVPIKEINNILKINVVKKLQKDKYWMIILAVIGIILLSIRVFTLVREDIYNFKLKKIYEAL